MKWKLVKNWKIAFMLLVLFTAIWIPDREGAAKTKENVQIQVSMNEARKMAKETAQEWAEVMEPDTNISVRDVQDVVTEDGSWEFLVSYAKGKNAYGYASVVVDEQGAVVKESVIDAGKETPLEEIKEAAKGQGELPEEESYEKEKLVAIGDLNYAAAYEDEDGDVVYVDEDGQAYTSEDLYGSKKYKDKKEIFIKKENWKSSKYEVKNKTKKVLSKYVGRTELVTSKKVEDLLDYYACSIQSLMQIAYMERLIGSYTPKNIEKFYKEMKSRNVIAWNNKQGDILCGNTYVEKAAKGFIKYAVDMGYKKTEFKGVKKNPDIDWIRNKIEYNRPILFGYHINLKGKKVGHMISVLGVMKAKKVSSGNTWNYIMVYNAWDDEVRFVNYDCVDFIDSIATYFWVKK